MTTFNDLVFDNNDSLFRRARTQFPNGYGASVIIGPYSYGGREGLYELAVLFNDDLTYESGLTEDVLGRLSPDEVTELLAKIEALPPREKT